MNKKFDPNIDISTADIFNLGEFAKGEDYKLVSSILHPPEPQNEPKSFKEHNVSFLLKIINSGIVFPSWLIIIFPLAWVTFFVYPNLSTNMNRRCMH